MGGSTVCDNMQKRVLRCECGSCKTNFRTHTYTHTQSHISRKLPLEKMRQVLTWLDRQCGTTVGPAHQYPQLAAIVSYRQQNVTAVRRIKGISNLVYYNLVLAMERLQVSPTKRFG